MMLPSVAAAARNNAEWCAAVCGSHGIPSSFGTDAWAAHLRSPARYPDAVTFEPTVTAAQLLPRIDGGPGCSIKDSFATLAQPPAGFRVLFDAEWIGREPVAAGDTDMWTPVADAVELRAWETAWSGGDAPTDVFTAALLEPLTIAFLAERIGRMIVAGAVLSYGADVVGVSNLFAENDDLDAAWRNATAAAATYFPRTPIVGYESGAALEAAQRSGFETLGPLRVWINDSDRDASPAAP
jgi:hypothetical protein